MAIPLALLSAAGSFAAKQAGNVINQGRNEKNMALQNDYWERQVNYLEQKNDPARQVAKWRRAGISPQAVFGSSPGGAGLATDSSAPNSDTPNDSASDYGFVQTLAERTRLRNETKVADAEVNLKEAQAAEARSRTTGQENENSIFELIKSAKQSAAGIAALEEKIKGIEAKWLEAEKAKDMEIKDSILRETDQRISKLMADETYQKQATEKLRSDMDLIKAQIATESSKQHNLDAQTQTENDLRKLRKALTQNQIKEITQRIRESRVLTAEGIEKLYAWLRGDREANSLFGVIDKYLTGTGKSLIEGQYNNDVRRYLYDLMSD